MKTKRDKPVIIVVKEAHRLSPATALDEEEMDKLPIGTTLKVEPVDARGHDQLAFYWLVLSHVVKATGRWPTKEKLHEALKWDLGYVSIAYNMLGHPRLVTDSIGLADMVDDERRVFMEQAFAKIAETIGTDPVSLVPVRARAA